MIKSWIPYFSIYTNLPIQITKNIFRINLKCFVWVMQNHSTKYTNNFIYNFTYIFCIASKGIEPQSIYGLSPTRVEGGFAHTKPL
jgi:hypothetical protein